MKLVELGTITRPHGLRGEVRVRLHYAGSDTLLTAEAVHVSREAGAGRPVAVEAARRANKAVLLKLYGVDDRSRAEELRGCAVSVPRDSLPEPEGGEFYLCDLVGADVFGPAGRLGRVLEVRAHPSVDALVIQATDGRVLEQPLCDPWIERVDLENGRVDLAVTEGLI